MHVFFSTIVFEYFKPFINEIFRSFDYIQRKNNVYNLSNTTHTKIAEIIRNFYDGEDVFCLTESKGRYISSWLNSLKYDLGCINFPAEKAIDIKYNPIYSREYTTKYINDKVKIPYLENYLSSY